MNLKNRKSNYDKNPYVEIKSFKNEVWSGYDNILKEILKEIKLRSNKKIVLVLDYYYGVFEKEIYLNIIKKIENAELINSEKAKIPEEELFPLLEKSITKDRVFGILTSKKLKEFFYKDEIKKLKDKIEKSTSKLIIVYGVGANLVYPENDILIYFDMSRWEIQKRFRSGKLGNWGVKNFTEDILRKYKRAFFIEWRVLDRHKKNIFSNIDYLIDTNVENTPKMISGNVLRDGLKQCTKQPFRVVPFFDPGVWGGQWMKEVCDLDRNEKNYAWCFDCVPEENSLKFKINEIIIEIPAQNLVLTEAKSLLGEKVFFRFGEEFPIRFDFLDTMGGQNLSLQVHPLKEYIKENFGMSYTQDESYYILDAKQNANVYLGVKTGIKKEEMIADLKEAQFGKKSFLDEKYINKFSAKKHDHFLIPAGTVHCSGKDVMVLEISATPYIFTFKLWDWNRLGLDGIPRPVHLEHGEKSIQFERETKWVKENLVNRIEIINDEEGIREEKTGLHEKEFIETRRHWFSKSVLHKTEGQVNVLNLIEGEEAIVESPKNKFKPFVVHYAETFIIPAGVEEYKITPYGLSEGKTIGTIKAFVRN